MAVLKMIIENDIQVWLALTIGVLYLAGKLEKRKYGIGGGIWESYDLSGKIYDALYAYGGCGLCNI